MTPLAIAVMQVLYMTSLALPMRCMGLPKGLRVGLGYLVSQFLALLVGTILNMAGCFSSALTFIVWLFVCVTLNLLCLRHAAPALAELKRTPWRTLVAGGIGVGLMLAVRLADPFFNAALSGTDSYHFVNFYNWIVHHRQAIHDYPSGFALVTAIAPLTVDPYAAARWAPHIVFVACLCAGYGLWQRLGGTLFAFLMVFLTGFAWFLYPVTAYHPHFVQWTMVFVGIPALLCLYQRIVQCRDMGRTVLIGALVNGTLAMTMAYFALYMNMALAGLVCVVSLQRQDRLKVLAAASGMALAVPAMLAFYYAFLAKRFFPYWDTGVRDITGSVWAISQYAADGSVATDAVRPWLGLVRNVFLPDWPLEVSLRWLLYAGLIGLGIWGWRSSRHRCRQEGVSLLAGLVVLSALSAMTGILEISGWGGRNVFVALYAALAMGLWLVLNRFSKLTRIIRTSRILFFGGLVLAGGPSLVYPPMIGRNVPVALVIQPRAIPADNQVMAELLRPESGAQGKRTLALVVSSADPVPDLMRNLLRLNRFTRETAFPVYRIEEVSDLWQALEADALLMPGSSESVEALPEGFLIHTQGPGYLFALRAETATGP